jgi:hypothetical protein
MGALVVVAALLLPVAPLLLRFHVTDRLTHRLTQEVGEDAVGLVYIGGFVAAFFAIVWGAGLTGTGPAVLVALALSTLAVVTFRLLNGENVDFD